MTYIMHIDYKLYILRYLQKNILWSYKYSKMKTSNKLFQITTVRRTRFLVVVSINKTVKSAEKLVVENGRTKPSKLMKR